MLTRGNVGVANSDVTEATGEEGSQSREVGDHEWVFVQRKGSIVNL